MKMMLPDVIGHENQSQHNQHHRCLCLDLSGRITTPDRFSYHTGTPFRYLLFSQNARSGTYCQISRNAVYLPFRHLFTLGRDDDYEIDAPLFYLLTASSRELHNRCTLYSDVIDIWSKTKVSYSSN